MSFGGMYSIQNPTQLSFSLLELIDSHEVDQTENGIPQIERNTDTDVCESVFAVYHNADDAIDPTGSTEGTSNELSVDITQDEMLDRRFSRERTLESPRDSSIREDTVPPPTRHSRFMCRLHFRNLFRSNRHPRQNPSRTRPYNSSFTSFPIPAYNYSSLTLGRNETIVSEMHTIDPEATYESAVPVVSSSSTLRAPVLAHPFLFGRRDVSIRRDTQRPFHFRSLFGGRSQVLNISHTDSPEFDEESYDDGNLYLEATSNSDVLRSGPTSREITPEDLLVNSLNTPSGETMISSFRPPTLNSADIGASFNLRRLNIRSSSRRRIATTPALSDVSSYDLFIARSGDSDNLQSFPLEFPMVSCENDRNINWHASEAIVSSDLTTTSASSIPRDTVRSRRRNFLHSLGRNREIFQMLGRFETQYNDPLYHSSTDNSLYASSNESQALPARKTEKVSYFLL